LSKEHREQFIEENRGTLKTMAKASNTNQIEKFLVNEKPACICIVCKNYYIDNDIDTEAQSSADKHFEKHPQCRAGTIDAVKALLESKPKKAVVNSAENEKFQKEMKRLRRDNEMLQSAIDEREEDNSRLEKYNRILCAIFGDGNDDSHFEDRFEYFKSKGAFPLTI